MVCTVQKKPYIYTITITLECSLCYLWCIEEIAFLHNYNNCRVQSLLSMVYRRKPTFTQSQELLSLFSSIDGVQKKPYIYRIKRTVKCDLYYLWCILSTQSQENNKCLEYIQLILYCTVSCRSKNKNNKKRNVPVFNGVKGRNRKFRK